MTDDTLRPMVRMTDVEHAELVDLFAREHEMELAALCRRLLADEEVNVQLLSLDGEKLRAEIEALPQADCLADFLMQVQGIGASLVLRSVCSAPKSVDVDWVRAECFFKDLLGVAARERARRRRQGLPRYATAREVLAAGGAPLGSDDTGPEDVDPNDAGIFQRASFADATSLVPADPELRRAAALERIEQHAEEIIGLSFAAGSDKRQAIIAAAREIATIAAAASRPTPEAASALTCAIVAGVQCAFAGLGLDVPKNLVRWYAAKVMEVAEVVEVRGARSSDEREQDPDGARIERVRKAESRASAEVKARVESKIDSIDAPVESLFDFDGAGTPLRRD